MVQNIDLLSFEHLPVMETPQSLGETSSSAKEVFQWKLFLISTFWFVPLASRPVTVHFQKEAGSAFSVSSNKAVVDST